MNKREIITIADPHLGSNQGDVDHFIKFLGSLPPRETRLLFLGDLFHIWAGPKKYHTDTVQDLMQALAQFRSKGGETYLVTGNRDVLFPGKPIDTQGSELPFDLIAPDYLELTTESGKLIAFHGDTVNTKDKQYLRWRKLIRHRLFQWIFLNLIPAKRVKRIMFSLEEKLKQTNPTFRKDFPEEEWQNFVQSVYQEHHPRLILAGHFHPSEPIISKHETVTALVVPDWCNNQKFLIIKDDLSFNHSKFKEKPEALTI